MLKNFKELNVEKVIPTLFGDLQNNSNISKGRKYGLTSQIRRSVVSIPSNIAEGYGRKTTLDYIRMLYISYSSVCELETQILLAGDLDLIEKSEMGALRSIADRKNAQSTDKVFR